MARRVSKSVMSQAGGTPSQVIKPSIDLKNGTSYALPINQRSIIFLFFEFGLFFAAALAMWPVDQTIAVILFAVAIALPSIMYYYDGRKTPRSATIYEDRLVLKYRFGSPVNIYWDDIEFLQKIEVFERLSSKSRPLGWIKSISMKSPVVLSDRAGDAAIYAYTLKKGLYPPKKLVEKELS
jgi:hypothetical protein